jgi:hypothetical protein
MSEWMTDERHAALRAICDTIVPSIDRAEDPTGFWARAASEIGTDAAIVEYLAVMPAEQRDGLLGLIDALGAQMTIAQEEIFGPVLSIIAYDTDEDAIRIANGTMYGLAGGVWSGDLERAQRVARRLRTGQVEINGGVFNPLAPFGGYKQSGNGRELGPHGLVEFTEVKALQL